MKISVIIADDEPLARQSIRDYLSEEHDFEVVAECADGISAEKAVKQLKPDLLFLDIQMPRLDGFEVLKSIPSELLPAVIFVTAYDEYAIRAFEIHALDYLLKPFSQQRFKTAAQRARQKLMVSNSARLSAELVAALANLRAATQGDPRIVVKSTDQILYLKPSEIDHAEAAGNYIVLHCGKAQHSIRETMTAMESRLEPYGFMRISRSELVNLASIGHLQPGVNPGEFYVILKTGERLNMTCSLAELQRRMQIL
jgi:two-component system, LytTR family, response regulator